MAISKFLFSEIALKKNLVQREQIDECLDIQRKLQEMGIEKTLGAVMLDKKYLSKIDVKEILSEMTTRSPDKKYHAVQGYEIVGKLGSGGMGSVYQALDSRLNRMVAMKILTPDQAADREFLARFLREARSAAKLNHPNIVKALDVGESHGHHYFAMEYVEGQSVKELIQSLGRVPEAQAANLIIQVADGLRHAWEFKMIHRDIKPGNIIVTKDNVAKLCDLGLAKQLDEGLEVTKVTKTGVVMGTPYYLSPEQARSEELDIRSDLYSLGITFYHMVTGEVPYTGNSAATILYKHIFMEPPDPRDRVSEVSEGVSQVIRKMIAKKPQDRYQTPGECIDDLLALGFRPVSLADSGPVQPVAADGGDALDAVVEEMMAQEPTERMDAVPSTPSVQEAVTSPIQLRDRTERVSDDAGADLIPVPGDKTAQAPAASHDPPGPITQAMADLAREAGDALGSPEAQEMPGAATIDTHRRQRRHFEPTATGATRSVRSHTGRERPTETVHSLESDIVKAPPKSPRAPRRPLPRKPLGLLVTGLLLASAAGYLLLEELPKPKKVQVPLKPISSTELLGQPGEADLNWEELQLEVRELAAGGRFGSALTRLDEASSGRTLSPATRLAIQQEQDRLVEEGVAALKALAASNGTTEERARAFQDLGLPILQQHLDREPTPPREASAPEVSDASGG